MDTDKVPIKVIVCSCCNAVFYETIRECVCQGNTCLTCKKCGFHCLCVKKRKTKPSSRIIPFATELRTNTIRFGEVLTREIPIEFDIPED